MHCFKIKEKTVKMDPVYDRIIPNTKNVRFAT